MERLLRQGLETRGMIVSVAGPSKSGKTVLVEGVVSPDSLIPLTGSRIHAPEDVWNHALDWMDLADEEVEEDSTSHSGTVTTGAKVQASFFGFGGGQASVEGALESGGQRGLSRKRRRRGMPQVIEEIGKSDFVLLIDDFHYIDRDVQAHVAEQLKEAARQEVKIIVASVTHRSDDVIRANTDLRGRVVSVDITYWNDADLMKIARVGFEKLKATVDEDSLKVFASEAAGSPQLMQLICLNACYVLGLDRSPPQRDFVLDGSTRNLTLQRTTSSTDYRTLVTILDTGPRARGTERKSYQFGNGEEGDVYTCVLRAMAADPPKLAFDYAEINRRIATVCDGQHPVGSSVVSSCDKMAQLALEKIPEQRVLDWDDEKQVLDIADPYLLFYLRWAGYKRV